MATQIPQQQNDANEAGQDIQTATDFSQMKLALRKLVRAVVRLEKRQERIISEIKHIKNKLQTHVGE